MRTLRRKLSSKPILLGGLMTQASEGASLFFHFMEQEGFGVGSEIACEQSQWGESGENFVAGAKCSFSRRLGT